MKKLILLFLFPFFILSGEDLTISEYIKNTGEDYRLKSKKEIADTFGKSKNTPLLKGVEFRTETKNFDILKQKYSLRFYFKGLGETKTSNSVINNYKDLYTVEYKIDFIDILLERYTVILESIETKKTLELLDSMTSVLEDKVAVLRKIGSISEDANLTEIVDTEEKLTDIELEKIELENRINSIELSVMEQTGVERKINFHNEKLITVDEIEKRIDEIEKAGTEKNILFEYRKQRVELAESELEMEKAKTYDFFNYLGMDYDTDDWETPRNSFSIGLALNIPGIKNDEVDISQKRADLVEEKLHSHPIVSKTHSVLHKNLNKIRT